MTVPFPLGACTPVRHPGGEAAVDARLLQQRRHIDDAPVVHLVQEASK